MLFYVTKWVTAHGILLLEGSKPESRGYSKRTWTTVRGAGRRMSTLSVGSEAFLTLEEAQVNARKRFEDRYKRALSDFQWARSARTSVRGGLPILVHKNPERVSRCQPFSK